MADKADARLVAIGAESRAYPLRTGKTSIGYARDNDLVIDSSTVSGHHATIQGRNGIYTLTDLESSNGTFVNSVLIKNPTILRRGDEVRFGNVRFAFISQSQGARRFRPGVFIAMIVVLFAIGFAAVRYRMTAAVSPHLEPVATGSVSIRPSPAPSPIAVLAPPKQPASSEPQPEWLALLNWYRKLCGLSLVSEDQKLTDGDRDHVQYLLTNYSDAIRSGAVPGGEMHQEREGSPGFTPQGAEAGRQSDIDYVYWHGHRPEGLVNFAIVDWISGPFHRLPLLNPDLRRIGYYDFCGAGLCVAAMNVLNGADPPRMNRLFPSPIMFPPDKAQVELRTFNDEWPDPLASCPGYAPPTGLPITLMLGSFVLARLDSFRIENTSAGSNTALDACGFDASSYTSSESDSQTAGREVLRANGTVVVVPRRPLDRGATYSVHVRINGQDHTWSFSVSR